MKITILKRLTHVQSSSGYYQKLLPTEVLITDTLEVKPEWYVYMRFIRSKLFECDGKWVPYEELTKMPGYKESNSRHRCAWDMEHWEDWDSTDGRVLYEHRGNYRVAFEDDADPEKIDGQQLCQLMTDAVEEWDDG
jgi:hypothetical protein